MRRAQRSSRCIDLGPLLAVALGAALCACERPEEPRPSDTKAAIPAALSDKAAAAEQAPEAAAPRSTERFAASNILIAYAGAEKAAPSVTRTKEEAKTLADQLYARITAGEELGALADRYSDGPERGHAGRLGVFSAAKMLPAISNAVAGLAEGAVAKPVESGMGYHIIRRDKIEEIYVAEIVVAFQGAQNVPAEVSRSREEALTRAGEAVAAARAEGAVFSDVVAKYSDHPTRTRAGILGRVFRGLLPPSLDALAFSLAPGEIGGPLEMPNGFTIVRRLPEVSIRHILVAYVGATRAPKGVARGREEAAALAAEILQKLERGDDFASLAKTYSDCPSKVRGGELGVVAEGTMTPRFERAVFSLAPGARSGLVETEFGYHVMERLR